jgi:ketosteroid isomerase-like protein
MDASDFDEARERSHAASLEITNGNAQEFVELFSAAEDITLANPFGGIARGPDEVREALERAASYYRDGEIVSIDHVTTYVGADVAYAVEIERFSARVAGRESRDTFALRVTSVFRREDGQWRLTHRQADTRVGRQSGESVLEDR